MKIKKHLLPFTMSLLLAGSLLTGCNSNEMAGNSQNTGAARALFEYQRRKQHTDQ